MNLKTLMKIKAAIGSGEGTLIEKEATGNPATFTTAVAKALKSFVVPLTHSQSGSGDPSPDNVRPITGVSSIAITHSGSVSNVALPYAVYGGTLDVSSGLLTVEWVGVDAGDLGWKKEYSAAAPYFYANLERNYNYKTSTPPQNNILCSNYSCASIGSSGDAEGFLGLKSMIRIRDNSYSDATTFKTAMSGVQIVYELETPYTVSLDPVTISTIKGENSISTNTSSNNTIVYYDKQTEGEDN